MIEKNFGLILFMSKKVGDASFFSYTLSIVSEGPQTTQSTALFFSLDCIDSMHNYAVKGSKYYREALRELFALPATIDVFKLIVKIFLRSFLRREQTNKARKIQCALQIVDMYRLHVDSQNVQGELSFYEKCAQEIANEYSSNSSSALTEQQQNHQAPATLFDHRIYPNLIALVQSLNWHGGKIPQLASTFKCNLEALLS